MPLALRYGGENRSTTSLQDCLQITHCLFAFQQNQFKIRFNCRLWGRQLETIQVSVQLESLPGKCKTFSTCGRCISWYMQTALSKPNNIFQLFDFFIPRTQTNFLLLSTAYYFYQVRLDSSCGFLALSCLATQLIYYRLFFKHSFLKNKIFLVCTLSFSSWTLWLISLRIKREAELLLM